VDGVTVLYDRACEDQDENELRSLAAELSDAMGAPVLASLLHDGDILQYWLYRDGTCLDAYNSLPSYFDNTTGSDTPEGGDATVLCEAFGETGAAAAVETLLRDPEIDAEDRHLALVAHLGFPGYAAGVGYDVIENGTLPVELDRARLRSTS
jgi:hypothetical protein